MRRSFDLAPMSPLILWLTAGLALLPLAFAVAALTGARALWIPTLLLVLLYAAVWLCARPRRFEADAGSLDVVFPTWVRSVPDVVGARTVTARELRDTCGVMLRIGVGGLWGGFGWLWSSRRGLIEFYISRTDGFVILERRAGRPLLITPDDPGGLVNVVAPHA
jgi:hypothetical protein